MRTGFRLFGLVLVALLAGGVSGAPCAEGPLTQAELEAIAEREAFRFIHGEDWLSWVAYCRGRGATDEMLVAAFSEISRRTSGAADGTAEAERCCRAVSLIPSFGPTRPQLAGIAFVAENAASDAARREAVWAYYSCTGGGEAFLDFAERILGATNLMEGAERKLFSCLYRDAKAKRLGSGQWHRRMSRLMRHYAEKDGAHCLLDADLILQWCEPGYGKTGFHRRLRGLLLKPQYRAFLERSRGAFASEALKRYSQEEADEAKGGK